VPRGPAAPYHTPTRPTASGAQLSVDLSRSDARLLGTVSAAEDPVAVLHAVSDDAAVAVLADRAIFWMAHSNESNVPTEFWYRISIVRR